MRNEMGDKIAMWIKSAAAAIGGAAAYLWGPWDALITALIALVAIDYVTGVICAAVNGKLNSSVGFKGLMKKALIFALVAVAGIADRVIPAANQALRAADIVLHGERGHKHNGKRGGIGPARAQAAKGHADKSAERERGRIKRPCPPGECGL